MHVTITTILNRFEAKTETPTTGVRHRLWLGIALCVLVPALSVVVPANAHLLLQTGAFVEIKPHNARRPLRAAAIIVPDPAESELRDTDEIVLRAPIEQVDRGAAVLTLLGQRIAITRTTRVPQSIQSLADLRPGQWIKIYARVGDDGEWHATRIRVSDIPRRLKIEGTITDISPDGIGGDDIALSGLRVLVSRNTAVSDHDRTPAERLFRKAIASRDPRQPSAWLITPHLWSRGKLGVSQQFEDNYTVGDSIADHYRGAQPQLKLTFGLAGPAGLHGLLRLRTRNEFVLKNAPLRSRNREAGVQVYEAFALWANILDAPLALQVGRQDFDEYREWLYDDQLDAIRGFAYPFYPIVGEVAVMHSLDDSPGNKFRTLTDYLAHVHGRVISGVELAAYRIWRTDTDKRGREPIWTGLRYRGNHGPLRPWLEVAWLRGEDKGRAFDAAATDLGATVSSRVGRWNLALTAGHAHGSGNSSDPHDTGIDQRFEQTGYEDNTSSLGGVVSLKYYGELFNPELSNMNILTLGGGVRLDDRASLEVIYHRYRQSEFSTKVVRSLEKSSLTVFDFGGRGCEDFPDCAKVKEDLYPYENIGWEIDVVLGIKRIASLVDLKWVFGVFHPGDALSPPFWKDLPGLRPAPRNAIFNEVNFEWRF